MFRQISRSALPVFLALAAANAAPPMRPFPQHTTYAAGTIKPNHLPQAALDEAARNFYASWKKTYLVPANESGQFYVLDDEESRKGGDAGGLTTSEGHGYGMLITAFMAGSDPQARELFDGLCRYFRGNPSHNNKHLMAWRQFNGNGKSRDESEDSATDGDLDIAQALLLADAQWGSAGPINYRAEARTLIAAIKRDEINREQWATKLGDWASPDDDKFNGTRPSDFMPDHFRSFAAATGDADWQKVIDTSYRLIGAMQANFSPTTGLIPDFIIHLDKTPTPASGKFLEGKHDGHFYFNSCRVPLRLGLDFLLQGEPRAKVALEKMNAWIKADTGGRADKVCAGYQLDGKPTSKSDRSLAFTACFGVGAMTDAAHQPWLNELWDCTVATDSPDDRYFGRTLKMLCLIAMSGNWWSPGGESAVNSSQ
jgi:endo-1,4-beta-D-glucanase Y